MIVLFSEFRTAEGLGLELRFSPSNSRASCEASENDCFLRSASVRTVAALAHILHRIEGGYTSAAAFTDLRVSVFRASQKNAPAQTINTLRIERAKYPSHVGLKANQIIMDI